MKSYKRLTLLILIILAAGVTYYIESGKPEVSLQTRAQVESELAKDPTFPARPVWWDKGHILGVGVLPNGQNRNSDAEHVCQLLTRYNIKPAEVQVFDVLQIQNDDEWVQIGGAICSR